MSGHVTKEELVVALERVTPFEHYGSDFRRWLDWVVDELCRRGLLAFDAPPMREPVALGTVVTASTRHSGERKFWTRFTNRERVHSTQCWIDERGTPATWADLVNPRPATHREP